VCKLSVTLPPPSPPVIATDEDCPEEVIKAAVGVLGCEAS
jgi:hypothetical protein